MGRSPRAKAGPSLEGIAADRLSGAAAIADSLIAWGEAWAAAGDYDPAPALLDVARTQSAMAPVLRIANDYLDALERIEGLDEPRRRRAIGAVAERWRSRLVAAGEALTLHLRRVLESAPTIYTYSASSSIRRALLAHAAAGRWFRVVCSESRPGMEGTALAVELAERGIPVVLGTDAWLFGAMEDDGVLLLGADALLPAAWVNKIGSRVLAERARARGRRVVVAADTSKCLPGALAAVPRSYERDPAEIAADPPPGLEVANPQFEEIPYGEIDLLVTERGPTRPRDLWSGEIAVARSLR